MSRDLEMSRIGRTQFSLAEAAAIIETTPGKLNTLVRHGIITPVPNERGTRFFWDQADLMRALVALYIVEEEGFDEQKLFSNLMKSERWKEIVSSAQNLGISLE